MAKLFSLFEYLPENNRIERIWKLAQVDFKKRYYNDKLGLLWALLNPIFRIAVYYFVFKTIFQSRQENYAIFLFSGFLFWMVFAETTKKGMHLLRVKKYLIENIQFNKIDLFISSSISIFIGFFFNLMAYIIICQLVGVPIFPTVVYLPVLIINLFILSMSVSMILSICQIYLKDIIHLWDVIIMLGFWTSGIFFTPEIYFEKYTFALYLNPFIGLIYHVRCALYDGAQPVLWLMIFNMVYGLFVFLIARWIFNKYAHMSIEKL